MGVKQSLVVKYDTFQYIPLLKSLKQLLNDSSILDEIAKVPQRVHSDGVMEDICDGDRFASHPLFKEDLNALQILAYYDEIELCNPLGSHINWELFSIL